MNSNNFNIENQDGVGWDLTHSSFAISEFWRNDQFSENEELTLHQDDKTYLFSPTQAPCKPESHPLMTEPVPIYHFRSSLLNFLKTYSEGEWLISRIA